MTNNFITTLFLLTLLFGGCSKKSKPFRPVVADMPIQSKINPDAEYSVFGSVDGERWFMDQNHVESSDIPFKIIECDLEGFLVCLLSPYPIFIPENFSKRAVFKIDAIRFELKMDASSYNDIKPFTCDNEGFWMAVETVDKKYSYIVKRNSGITVIDIYIKGQFGNFISGGSLYLAKGKLFPFEEICP